VYHKNPPTTLAKRTTATKTVRKENFLFTPSANIFFIISFSFVSFSLLDFGLKQQGKKYYKQHNIPKKKHTFMISEARPHLIVLWEKNAIKTTSNIIIYSTFAFFCYILAKQKKIIIKKMEKFNVAERKCIERLETKIFLCV